MSTTPVVGVEASATGGEFGRRLLWSWRQMIQMVDRKIWSLTELDKLIMRRAEAHKEMSKAIEKVVHKVPSQMRDDGGVQLFEELCVAEAWNTVMRTELERSHVHAALASTLKDRVHMVMECAINAAEAAKKKTVMEGAPLWKQHAEATVAMNKARDRYHKLSAEAETAATAYAALKEQASTQQANSLQQSPQQIANDLMKAEKKATKTKDEADEAEESYREYLSTANEKSENYRRLMPRLVADCEMVMKMRCEAIRDALRMYAEASQRACADEAPLFSAVERAASGIKAELDLAEFARREDSSGLCPPLTYMFEPYLKGKGAMQQKQGTRSARPDQQAATTIYGVPLDVLIDTEAALPNNSNKVWPQGVPRVVHYLASEVLALGGAQSKGIFRLAGDADEVSRFREQASNTAPSFPKLTDPHDAAVALKLWMRSLPEPLIPVTMYEKCVAENADAVSVYDQLPEPNKTVIGYVIQFLQYMCKPEYSELTAMPESNMAAMFSPCLMRCPYEDLQLTLVSVEKERKFVMGLITNLDTSRIPKFIIPTHIAPPPSDLSGHNVVLAAAAAQQQQQQTATQAQQQQQQQTTDLINAPLIVPTSVDDVSMQQHKNTGVFTAVTTFSPVRPSGGVAMGSNRMMTLRGTKTISPFGTSMKVESPIPQPPPVTPPEEHIPPPLTTPPPPSQQQQNKRWTSKPMMMERPHTTQIVLGGNHEEILPPEAPPPPMSNAPSHPSSTDIPPPPSSSSSSPQQQQQQQQQQRINSPPTPTIWQPPPPPPTVMRPPAKSLPPPPPAKSLPPPPPKPKPNN